MIDINDLPEREIDPPEPYLREEDDGDAYERYRQREIDDEFMARGVSRDRVRARLRLALGQLVQHNHFNRRELIQTLKDALRALESDLQEPAK